MRSVETQARRAQSLRKEVRQKALEGLASTPGAQDPGAGRSGRFAVKLYYGFGAVAYGVKDNGFSYFLLLFYNQVLGLLAAWVGAAIMIALLVDAFSDPMVGCASDNLHSRWGRRHPLMYASALCAWSFHSNAAPVACATQSTMNWYDGRGSMPRAFRG